MNRGSIADARDGHKVVWGGNAGRLGCRAAVLALTVFSASCGDLTRQGTGSSYLIVNSLEGASGADPGEFGSPLLSDVITLVGEDPKVPTIFNDLGQVTFTLAMKDALLEPTSNNFITVNRYRVRYIRADGRNTPGVDVPFGFDGAFTATVSGETTVAFELVRHIAKQEAPLGTLARNNTIISTIAEVTFFGRDQTGREVSVTGQMLVNFGNFADPD